MSAQDGTVWIVGLVNPWASARVRDSLGGESTLAPPVPESIGFVMVFDSKEDALKHSDGLNVWSMERADV